MLELWDCRVDLATGAVEGGSATPLTDRERRVLAFLAARPSVAVSRDDLHREVFGHAASVVSRAVDTTVFRLREKVEGDPKRPRHVLTAHGLGYRFEPRREGAAALVPAAPRRILALGDRRVDLDVGEVHGPDGAVPLTETDLAVLRHLADHAGRFVDARDLARTAGAAVGRGLVHRVRRLRKLLEPEPDRPRHLLSVRGRGYRLVPSASAGGRAAVTLVQVRVAGDPPGDAYGQALSALDARAAAAGGLRLSDGWRYAFEDAAAAVSFAADLPTTCPVAVGVAVVGGRPLVWTDPVSGRAAAVGAEVHRAEDLALRAGPAVLVDAELWADPTARGARTGRSVGGGAVRLGDDGPDVRATALPWLGDRFVGRHGLLEAVVAALGEPGALLTLEGPPGVGKSRLALEALGRVGARVVHVRLRDATRPGDLVPAVAAAVGVLGPDPDPEAQLVRVLASLGRAVLWLDDADRVASGAERVRGWLGAAPGLTVLATARRALGVEGERVLAVAPMDATEAALLFAARAPGVSPGDPALAEVVRALDGLPLALELAAARTRVMPLDRLLRELPDRLRLLSPLRAALDLSWELLAGPEREALCRAAVFRAPFTLDAAEVVLDTGDGWVVDRLEALVRHHLVRVEGDRYALLESVRHYAAEKLDADPAARDRAWEAHARAFAAWGGRAALAALGRSPGDPRLAALVLELPDLEDAVTHAAALGLTDAGEGAALALAEVRLRRGPFAAALPFLDAAVALDGRRLPELLLRRGHLRKLAGDPDGAQADLETASARALAVGDLVTHAHAETRMGSALGDLLTPEAVHAHHRRALEAVASRLHEPGADRVMGLARLGLSDRVDPSVAVPRLEEALGPIRRSGDRELEAQGLGMLSVAERVRGRTRRARELAEQALALHRALGDRRGEAICLGNLANTLRFDDPDAGREYNLASAEVHRSCGNRRNEALAIGNLGAMAWDRGDLEATRAAFVEAVDLLVATGARLNESLFRGNLGGVLCKLGRVAEGHEQLLRAIELARSLNEPRMLANPVLSLTQFPEFEGAVGLALLAEAEAGPAHAPDGHAYLVARRARLLYRMGDLAGARAERDRAEALLAAVGEDAQIDEVMRTELRLLRTWLDGP